MTRPNLWVTRDLPVLEVLTDHFATRPGSPLDDSDLRAAAQIDLEEAWAAVHYLESSGYLRDVHWYGGMSGFTVVGVTERALREIGYWPSSESAADHLLWVLEQKVDGASTPEERTRWSRVRDSVGGAGKDLAVELMAAVLARHVGG